MKKIHKIIFLVLGIQTLVLIESNPEYSTGAFRIIRKKVLEISAKVITKSGSSPQQLQNISSSLN